jgi:CBS domain-containing protein
LAKSDAVPAAPMRVRDLMTAEVFSATLSDSIASADLEMRFARVRHMPIVDASGRLAGIVSRQDVREAFAANKAKLALPTASVMRAEVFTVGPDATLASALAVLIDNKISALPVVDEQRRLLGILTDTDVLRWAYEQLTGSTYQTPPIE